MAGAVEHEVDDDHDCSAGATVSRYRDSAALRALLSNSRRPTEDDNCAAVVVHSRCRPARPGDPVCQSVNDDLRRSGILGTRLSRSMTVNYEPAQCTQGEGNSLLAVALAQQLLGQIAERRPRQRGEGKRAGDVDGGEAEPRGEQAV